MRVFSVTIGLILVVFASANLSAQRLEAEIKVNRPNFSGRWKLNAVNPGRVSPRDRRSEAVLLIIDHREPMVILTLKRQVGLGDEENYIGGRYTLYADRRGDLYPPDEPLKLRSVSEWKDRKLASTFYVGGRDEVPGVQKVSTLEISADGKTLTQTNRYTEVVLDRNGKPTRMFDDSQTQHFTFTRLQ